MKLTVSGIWVFSWLAISFQDTVFYHYQRACSHEIVISYTAYTCSPASAGQFKLWIKTLTLSLFLVFGRDLGISYAYHKLQICWLMSRRSLFISIIYLVGVFDVEAWKYAYLEHHRFFYLKFVLVYSDEIDSVYINLDGLESVCVCIL